MADKSWTLILAPHSNDKPPRQIRLNRTVLVTCMLLAAGILTAAVWLGAEALVEIYFTRRMAVLRQENQILRSRVAAVDKQIERMDGLVGELLGENQQFRCVAGLDMLDKDVIEAGVGGISYLNNNDALFEMDSRLAGQLYRQEIELDELIRKSELARQSLDDAIISLSETSDKWEHYPSIKPSSGYISSSYGRRLHPILGRNHFHCGIDIRTSVGEPVLASANGVVVEARKRGGFGNTVVIDHGYGVQTVYAHMSRLLVEEGMVVERGRVVGEVGSTGFTTGSHLHYEVHINGRPHNPQSYILDNFVP